MKFEDCKYYELINGTIFCNSKNHKNRVVRIDREDALKDIDCRWADMEGEKNG